MPAGDYHVVCDAIIIRSVDVTFDLVWRRGTTDTPLASWQQHFDPTPGGSFKAQPYELDVTGPAIDFHAGDELIFRYTGTNSEASMGFIPNGEGTRADGRIPNITLPP